MGLKRDIYPILLLDTRTVCSNVSVSHRGSGITGQLDLLGSSQIDVAEYRARIGQMLSDPNFVSGSLRNWLQWSFHSQRDDEDSSWCKMCQSMPIWH
jgi:hypothetical protein